MQSIRLHSARHAGTAPHAARPWFCWIALGLMIGVLIILPDATAHAATHTWFVAPTGQDNKVCTAPDKPCKTIAATLAKAARGDTIIVAAGTYPENLAITKSLSVIGAGAATTLIDGQSRGTVVTIAVPYTAPFSVVVSLSRMTLQHGSGGTAAGITNYGTLTMTDVMLIQNRQGDLAGGLYNFGSATLTRVTITQNAGGHVGGVSANQGLTITDSI